MQYYTARIRLQSSPTLEAWKYNLSAPELMLINAMHGGSAVAEYTPTSDKPFTSADHRALRAKLEADYGTKQKILDKFYGLFGQGKAALLPETVTDQDLGINVAPQDDEAEHAPAAPAAQAAPAPAQAVEDDPVKVIRDSLTKLGAPLPKPTASVEEHRAALVKAQQRLAAVDMAN